MASFHDVPDSMIGYQIHTKHCQAHRSTLIPPNKTLVNRKSCRKKHTINKYKVKQPCPFHKICNEFFNCFGSDIKRPFGGSLNSNGSNIVFSSLIIQFKNYSFEKSSKQQRININRDKKRTGVDKLNIGSK